MAKLFIDTYTDTPVFTTGNTKPFHGDPEGLLEVMYVEPSKTINRGQTIFVRKSYLEAVDSYTDDEVQQAYKSFLNELEQEKLYKMEGDMLREERRKLFTPSDANLKTVYFPKHIVEALTGRIV